MLVAKSEPKTLETCTRRYYQTRINYKKTTQIGKKVFLQYSKASSADFMKADFGLFRDLLRRIPWDTTLVQRGAQESWLMFKDHLLQAQERCIPTERKSGKKHQEACTDEQGAPGQTQAHKGSLQCRSKDREHGRNTQKLAEQRGIRLGKLKP